MTEEFVLRIALQALYLIMILSAPALLVSLGIGLLVSVFQAATSVQEVTLTFVPKILGVFLVLAVMGSWLLGRLMEFTLQLFGELHRAVGF